MNRKAVNLLVSQADEAFKLLDGTMAGLKIAHLKYLPLGKAHPLGVTYFHVFNGLDQVINGMFLKKPTLGSTTFKGKTGVSIEVPDYAVGEEKLSQWYRKVKVDMKKTDEYAKATKALLYSYLKKLDDADLDKKMDMSGMGLGKQTYGWVLSNFVTNHIFCHIGEIAAIKGVQGLKGYPF